MTEAISTEAVAEFLAQRRIAVVGASDDPKQWGNTLARALREHGIDVVAVHPTGAQREVPPDVDGVLVVVDRSRSTAVVRQALDAGVRRIWLFQGIGAPGAVNDEALRLCREAGAVVIPGACPLMFLEPVTIGHRLHRAIRRRRGAIAA